jgi:hypothetical protein
MRARKTQVAAVPKKQATEEEIMNLLFPMQEDALTKFHDAIKEGNFNFIKLYLEYRFGRPKQQTEASTSDVQEFVRIVEGKAMDNEV